MASTWTSITGPDIGVTLNRLFQDYLVAAGINSIGGSPTVSVTAASPGGVNGWQVLNSNWVSNTHHFVGLTGWDGTSKIPMRWLANSPIANLSQSIIPTGSVVTAANLLTYFTTNYVPFIKAVIAAVTGGTWVASQIAQATQSAWPASCVYWQGLLSQGSYDICGFSATAELVQFGGVFSGDTYSREGQFDSLASNPGGAGPDMTPALNNLVTAVQECAWNDLVFNLNNGDYIFTMKGAART